jgi:hypothetical protein
VVCDDAIFIASCINHAYAHEILWPIIQKKHMLGTTILEFQGYIGLIDGTLIKIHKPWNNHEHNISFNGCKKIFLMNNTMVVDH